MHTDHVRFVVSPVDESDINHKNQKSDRPVFVAYLGTAAFLSGSNWELLEFWYSGAQELQHATSLTLYSDTIKNLFTDGVGGLFTVLVYRKKFF